MKCVLSICLLAGLIGMVGCARYHPGGTSPYYTSYYDTYDSSRHCYYHCCDYRGSRSSFVGSSFRGTGTGSGHHHGGSSDHEHHQDSGHSHHK